MVIFSGIVIVLQIWLLVMALFYVRQKDAAYPDRGYHLWKQQAFSSLVPLGIALFTFTRIRSLSTMAFLVLSVEALALGLLVLCLFYLRPRRLADKAATRLSYWKLVTILSIAIAVIGLLLPIVFIL